MVEQLMHDTDRTAAVVDDIVAFLKREIIRDDTIHLTMDDRIIEAGLIDSMGIVRLLAHLQQRYGIDHIANQDLSLQNFRSIGSIAALVSRYL